jgi:haloalkane dehalogenase
MHYVDERPLDVGGVSGASLNVGGVSDADEMRNGRSATESPPTETLLFVHGNPTWSFHWRRLILALRTRYRCVAPDHIGCGLSEKPQRYLTLDDHIENLSRLIESLQLDHITLIAQDWGGAIGLGAMLRMQERFDRIVLFNTGAFPPRYIPWRIRACRIPMIGRIAVQGANAFSRAALRMTLARRSRLEPAVAAGYLAPYDSWANRRAVYGFVRDIPSARRRVSPKLATESRRDSATWLTAIERGLPTLADRPALLIWGMRDWCFRPDCLDRFLEAWPQAEVHRLADVGHWVVEDAPQESLSIVERFLESGVGCQVSGVRSGTRHPTPDT